MNHESCRKPLQTHSLTFSSTELCSTSCICHMEWFSITLIAFWHFPSLFELSHKCHLLKLQKQSIWSQKLSTWFTMSHWVEQKHLATNCGWIPVFFWLASDWFLCSKASKNKQLLWWVIFWPCSQCGLWCTAFPVLCDAKFEATLSFHYALWPYSQTECQCILHCALKNAQMMAVHGHFCFSGHAPLPLEFISLESTQIMTMHSCFCFSGCALQPLLCFLPNKTQIVIVHRWFLLLFLSHALWPLEHFFLKNAHKLLQCAVAFYFHFIF